MIVNTVIAQAVPNACAGSFTDGGGNLITWNSLTVCQTGETGTDAQQQGNGNLCPGRPFRATDVLTIGETLSKIAEKMGVKLTGDCHKTVHHRVAPVVLGK